MDNKNFIIEKYMGFWYQIASIPMFYGLDCVNSTANYTLSNGIVIVDNTCYTQKGAIQNRSANGTAKMMANKYDNVMAALRVDFPVPTIAENIKISGVQLPSNASKDFSKYINADKSQANYLIHYTDYENYALIGSPDKTSLYILSRYATISKSSYAKISKYLCSLGYDTSKLQIDQGKVV